VRVAVSTKGAFSFGVPEPLFEHPTLRGTGAPFPRYAVANDGSKFLTVESERELAKPVVRIVQNWFSQFRRAAQNISH